MFQRTALASVQGRFVRHLQRIVNRLQQPFGKLAGDLGEPSAQASQCARRAWSRRITFGLGFQQLVAKKIVAEEVVC